MNFCLLTSSYPQSPEESVNAGVFVREFALELHKRGHRVTIFTPAKAREIAPDDGIEVHAFPWLGKELVLTRLEPRRPADALRLLHLWWAGVREIRRWGPERSFDRLLAFWAIPSGWFGLQLHRKTGVPLDVWALGSDIWRRKRYPFGDRVVKRILSEADNVFADGTGLAQEAQTLAGRPVRLLRSLRRLPPAEAAPDLAPDSCHFVFVGRWDSVKGLDVFVEAFLGLEDLPCQAHIFGEGQQAGWLTARLQSVRGGRVHVHGTVPPKELAAYLKASDFAVISSRQESLPVFFSDAMQAGLPVIASDVGDLRGLIEKHQVGIVVPPNDVPALSQALRQAYAAKKSRWEAACRKLGSALDPARMVDEYLAIVSPKK